MDVNNLDSLRRFLNKFESIDLLFSSECLSYLEKWKEVLEIVSRKVNYLLISLFIPDNPIGYVKSEAVSE